MRDDSSAVHEFDRFADELHARREVIARARSVAQQTVEQRGEREPAPAFIMTSHLLEDAVAGLGAAEEELRQQNDALFAARFDLESSETLFRELFELAPVAYVVTDFDGTIRRVNSGACALLGRPTNVLVGKPLACYVALDERSAFREALRRSVDSPSVEEWPICFSRDAGDPLDCRVRVRVLRSPSGGSQGLAWVITGTPPDSLDL